MEILFQQPNNRFNFSFIISLTIHIVLGFLVFYIGFHEIDKERVITTLDSVEFMESTKPKKNFNLLKMAMPKVVQKPIKTVEIEGKDMPVLEDKQEPIRRKKITFDKKIETKSTKIIDLNKQVKTRTSIKEIETEKISLDSRKVDLGSNDIKALISLEEVGDRKASKKTLDVLKKIESKTRVIKDFSFSQKLVDKKIKNLDRKIDKMTDLPTVSLSEKKIDRAKTFDVPKHGNSKKSSQIVMLDETVKIEDRGSINRRRKIGSNIGNVNSAQKGEIDIVEYKRVRKSGSRNISSAKKETKQVNKIVEKKIDSKREKDIEITGPLKDREIVRFFVPEYPAWARAEGIEARVELFFVVVPGGSVEHESVRVEITSGYSELDDVAIQTLKRWQFVVLNNDDNQWGYITFKFKLK